MAGMMPSTQWEMKNYHQKYYAGNTISVGIGQGETQVTPIQLLRALSGIASDGHFVRPHSVSPTSCRRSSTRRCWTASRAQATRRFR